LLGVLGVLVGLGLVLVGLLTTIVALSVVGFVVLVAASAYGVQSLRHRGTTSAGEAGAAAPRPPRPGTLRSRMEDRMRRRFDEN
jgi:hypothetical protein